MINVLLSINNFDEPWAYNTLVYFINPTDKVLIVPFSYHEDWLYDNETWERAFNKISGTHYKEIINPFLEYDIEESNIKWINQFTDTIDEMKNKIKESDIIFFTGGYPEKMYERFCKYDITKELENFEGIMMGMSAGAMVQLQEYHVYPDQDYNNFDYYNGLNIINDFDVSVHYDNGEVQNICILKAINEKKKPVYAITDSGGLIVIGGHVIELGDVEYWEVYDNENIF